MKNRFVFPALLSLVALTGCTHFSGTVEDSVAHQPISTAVITEGLPRPDYAPKQYWVDQNGHFSFDTSAPLTTTTFYVWRSPMMAEPDLNSVGVAGTQMAQNMVIMLQPRQDFRPAVLPMTMPSAPMP
jgi:hypothetical protein